ncbi:hypothetical protein CSOJ01_15907 [Colletotrichum sojae]|uniref:Uncharacterized protein n=1 Tax=Colletotrichum sojae TaxID=2175907 RepID=A0A8H6MGP8_9PEZI|nr:hypothetical protein CSOJ01_15907 [Colletotrichum sojae]
MMLSLDWLPDSLFSIPRHRHVGTQEVALYPVNYAPNRAIWLVETPGFDDTNRNDTDVLKEIVTWFTNSYRENVKLHGIINLYRISDTRMTGGGMRNLAMFRKLCGPDALEHVVLARPSSGSTMLRHGNNRESAMRLIDHIVDKPAEAATTVLDLQKEMVDKSLSLAMTAAGQSVDGGLLKQSKQFKKTRTDLQQELADARQSNDRKMADLLERERQKTQAQLSELAQQREDLQVTLDRLMQTREKMKRRRWWAPWSRRED